MKRLLSVVLSALLLVASFATVSAEVAAPTIEVTTNVYSITAEVTADVDGTMTAQLVNTANNVIYGAASSSAPTASNGKYIYTFNFTMPYDAVTAQYVVKVGNNVPKTTQSFQYQDIADKINFYNTLDTKAVGEIKGYFASNPTLVPVDVTAYNNLSDGTGEDGANVLALVDAKIVELNLATGVLNTDDAATKASKVSAVETAFTTAYNNAMAIALIADVSESDWETVAEDAMTDTTFDNEYYIVQRTDNPDADELNDEILLNIADAYDYFKAESETVTTLDLVEYQNAFDRATLLLVTDTLDYASVKDAFLYYEAKSIITPDMTNITALVNAGKDAQLWKDLKTSGYTDIATLVANAESIAQTMVDNGALIQAPVGGNMPSNTPTTDKPSKPGASMGIVSDPTITPAEPVNPVQPKPVEGFADLAQAEWSREAVEYLADKGVISGKDANTFAPNDAVTREEGAKIIVAAFDLLSDAECEFTDVAADRWSYAYIAAAVEAGIITGYGDSFGPTDTMTREQAATIIFRAAEKIALELSGEKAEFTDGADTSDWAADAIAHLAADGVINGMGDGTFAPKATLTRAQLAQLVYNVLVTIGGVN